MHAMRATHKIAEKSQNGLRVPCYTFYGVKMSSKTYRTLYLIYSPSQIVVLLMYYVIIISH
jgi:hypothetical protein